MTEMSPSLAVVIPTFNRSGLLTECLESILRAPKPATLDWRVSVVDNNSSDGTAEVVRSFVEKHGDRVRYLFEKRQGKSAALNRGVGASDRDLVGTIDDDEQVGEAWFRVIDEWFSNPAVDFIGGPYLPLWRAPRPDWLPAGREGVLGADEIDITASSPLPFGSPGSFLRGGNAVLRRATLKRVGEYSVSLGPKGNDFGSCEDHDMYNRLLATGASGYFVPQLVVFHNVPPDRITRKYFRLWALGRATSPAALDLRNRQNVKYIRRVPRYMVGDAVRAIFTFLRSGKPSERFAAELRWWDLAGFIYGAYLRRDPKED